MASDSENESSGTEEVAPARRTRSTRSTRGAAKTTSPSKARGRGRGGGRRGKGRGRGKQAAKPETESSGEEASADEEESNKANGVQPALQDEDNNGAASPEEAVAKEESSPEPEPDPEEEVKEESSPEQEVKQESASEEEPEKEEIAEMKEEEPVSSPEEAQKEEKLVEEVKTEVVEVKEEPMETEESKPEADADSGEEKKDEAKEDKGDKQRKRRGFSDTPPEDLEPAKKIKEVNGESKEEERKKKLPELEKYWKAVKDDSADFTGWTYLLQYVDQESDAEAAREAYDAFLTLYPYCYGYWRKYADYEKKKGEAALSDKVFERGLKAIPLSVDLWLHFLNHCKTVTAPAAADEDFIRLQFELALTKCGMEFRSDRLWESYLKWETELKNWPRVLALYDRLLATPTQGYTTHFDSFEAFAKEHLPQKLLSVDEFLELRKQWLAERKGDESEMMEERQKEEVLALREKVIEARKAVHKATVKAVADRWAFEEAIKRPYFHVKPLEKGQLKNWKDYLEYEIEQGDRDRIIVLFERCLIACALYDEYWTKFLDYLEGQKDASLTGKISEVFTRACTIHHPKKPAIQLKWAAFEEGRGHVDSACEILEGLDKRLPNTLQVAYRRINLERRRGCLEKVAALYDGYISSYKNVTIGSALSVKYARFLCKLRADPGGALAVLNKALDKDKHNSRLYLNVVDICMQKSPMDVSGIVATFDRFLQLPDAGAQAKHLFAQRKLEFLEDFGQDMESVLRATEETAVWQKAVKEAKKEPKDEASSKDAPPPKKSKQEYGAQAVAAAGGYGAQQAGYNYPGYQQGGYYNQGGADYYNWQQQQQQYQQGYGAQGWGGGGGGAGGGGGGGNYNNYY